MKLFLDCIPCALRQALQGARFCNADPETQERILRHVLKDVESVDWNSSPMDLSRIVQQIVSQETSNPDPYREVKDLSNKHVLSLLDQLREDIRNAADPFEEAVRLAILGNVMDYGAKAQFDIAETLESAHTTPFGRSDAPRLRAAIESADSIAYLADNAGEIVFDRLFLETIVDIFGPRKIRLVVRRNPFINDATGEDALNVGIVEVPGVELLTMDPFIPRAENDHGWSEWSEITGSDVIIAKGQGNYEAFSSCEGFFFLFVVKCLLVGEDIGGRIGRSMNEGDMILWQSDGAGPQS